MGSATAVGAIPAGFSFPEGTIAFSGGAFDTQVMERVRPHRLTPIGRLVIAIYIVLAAGTAAWFMRELPVEWIAAAVVASAGIAARASAYGRRVAFGE